VNHIEHKRNRSGISRLVAGPAAATYCQLVASYTAKGRQTAVGAHQFGELDGEGKKVAVLKAVKLLEHLIKTTKN
jgi:hypothetical protein